MPVESIGAFTLTQAECEARMIQTRGADVRQARNTGKWRCGNLSPAERSRIPTSSATPVFVGARRVLVFADDAAGDLRAVMLRQMPTPRRSAD